MHHVARGLVLLAALATLAPVARAAPVTFRIHDLSPGHPVRQDVFVVPTAPGERSLVVAGIRENGHAALSVFPVAGDGSLPARPLRTQDLPDDVLALDSDGQALYALTPDGVSRWNPADGSFTSVAESRSLFQVRPPQELVPVRFVRDVDGDGDSDLAVPDFQGYRIFLQGADGFSAGALLPLRPIAHNQEYNRRITYRAVPLWFHDVDGDGTRDGVAARGDTLIVFRGEGEGRFAAPRSIEMGLGITETFLGDEVGDVDVDHTDRTWKRAVQVRDFDGDGVVDVFTHRVHSSGLFDKQHSLELHRGERRGETLELASRPPSRVESAVVIDDPSFQDVDGDGRIDFSSWSVAFGIRTILSWLVTGKVDLAISVYRLGENGQYPAEPSRREAVDVAFDLKSGKPTVPPAFLADVNGDKKRDLILGGERGLEVFPGNGSPQLFAAEPDVTAVPLPGNGRDLVSAADVDGDGKDDLVIRYGKIDGARKDTMKVLIAR